MLLRNNHVSHYLLLCVGIASPKKNNKQTGKDYFNCEKKQCLKLITHLVLQYKNTRMEDACGVQEPEESFLAFLAPRNQPGSSQAPVVICPAIGISFCGQYWS